MVLALPHIPKYFKSGPILVPESFQIFRKFPESFQRFRKFPEVSGIYLNIPEVSGGLATQFGDKDNPVLNPTSARAEMKLQSGIDICRPYSE